MDSSPSSDRDPPVGGSSEPDAGLLDREAVCDGDQVFFGDVFMWNSVLERFRSQLDGTNWNADSVFQEDRMANDNRCLS